MVMLSFICMVFLCESESVQVFYCLFISVLSVDIQLSTRKGREPIHCYNLDIMLCLSRTNTFVLCSMGFGDKKCLFVLLILVEFLTFTV